MSRWSYCHGPAKKVKNNRKIAVLSIKSGYSPMNMGVSSY